MECVIDRSKATIPIGSTLWKVTFTYGATSKVYVLVSAETKRKAFDIVNDVYDYLKPKMLGIEFIDDDNETIWDMSKELILGKLNIKGE